MANLDRPPGTPDTRGEKKGKLDGELEIVEVEGMPAWASAMQETLMKHTSMKMDADYSLLVFASNLGNFV